MSSDCRPWFETRGFAALLTMRRSKSKLLDPRDSLILRSVAQRRVSKDGPQARPR